MRRLWLVSGLVAATVGCAAGTVAGHPTAARPSGPAENPATSGPATQTVPAEPVPAKDGPCPYLETSFVADTNGQRVSKVRVSADAPHPACFFYRADGGEQVRVRVVVGVDPVVAKAIVDAAAPVASSDPASLAGGWQGGKQPTDTGAVFAVARAGTAVVVVINQKQTFKASRIAEQAIATLGL